MSPIPLSGLPRAASAPRDVGAAEAKSDLLRVRRGYPTDEIAVISMCRSLHEENGLFGMRDDLVLPVIRRALNQDGAAIGLIEQDGEILAMMLLFVETAWYSGAKYLMELFVFVKPEARKLPCARSLIEWAKRCSVDLGMPLIVGIVSQHRLEAKERLYSGSLNRAGAFFIHNSELAAHDRAALMLA